LPDYLAWIKERKCIACQVSLERWIELPRFNYPIDPAHTVNNGMRSKGPDSSCVPLCRGHHDQFDGRAKLPNGEFGGHANFATFFGIDMTREAAAHFAVFLLDSVTADKHN
jgi:hypothetical protein